MRFLSLTLLIFVAGPALAGAEPPSARDVVFRGGRSLDHLLLLATRDAWREPGRMRPVVIVLDVTPFTAFAEPELRAALTALQSEVGDLRGDWRIGRLGDPPAFSARSPGDLAAKVPHVLATESRQAGTIEGLRRSLRSWPPKGGIVVYLADGRFEDDHGLEPFIAELRKRSLSLRVIGPESGFGRAFHHEDGRSPFEPGDREAPWRGGDTAWPHIPWQFIEVRYDMVFTFGLPRNLADRIRGFLASHRRGREANRDEFVAELRRDRPYIGLSAPLSSSWGPYGLMRACAETGGRYHLWSWNPFVESDLVYDYGRCRHFPPDLRPRAEILADVPRRPLAVALLRAWGILAAPDLGIFRTTPAIDPESFEPRVVEMAGGGRGIPHPWRSPGERKRWALEFPRHLLAIDRAIAILTAALGAGRPRDDVDARYRADVELSLHLLRVGRFQLVERRGAFYAAEEKMTERIAADPKTEWVWQPVWWVHPGDDPENLVVTDVRPHNPEAALALLATHRDYLRRFRGTPFGEIVARNGITSYRIVPHRPDPQDPGKRTKVNSSTKGETTPTPGGSTGSGTPTGK